MHTTYALPSNLWRQIPLEARLPDDDDAYTLVKLRQGEVCVAELTECIARPVYDKPVDIHGNVDDSMLLGGGMKGGSVFGVETVIRGLELANKLLIQVSDGEFQLVVVEVLRRPARQRAGFVKTYHQMLEADQITSPSTLQILDYGKRASRIFSYPKALEDERFQRLVELLSETNDVQEAALEIGRRTNTPTYRLIAEYGMICANLDIKEAADYSISLPASHIVHGGGAADFFIADAKGRVLSVVPFDYPNAKLAAFRFTESDENYDVLIEEATRDPRLGNHFKKLGFATPASFTRTDWQYFKEANRMQVRLMIAMNGTTYMDERWHFEFGTFVTDLNGQAVITDPLASEFPNSGGPGYTSIKLGESGTAVWHTAVTEAALRKQSLIDD